MLWWRALMIRSLSVSNVGGGNSALTTLLNIVCILLCLLIYWYSFWCFVNSTVKLLIELNDFNCMGLFSENCFQLTIVQENLHCSLVGVSSQELCGVWPPWVYEMAKDIEPHEVVNSLNIWHHYTDEVWLLTGASLHPYTLTSRMTMRMRAAWRTRQCLYSKPQLSLIPYFCSSKTNAYLLLDV